MQNKTLEFLKKLKPTKNEIDKNLAMQIFCNENFNKATQYTQISKDRVIIPAIKSPNNLHTIFPEFTGSIATNNEKLRERYNQYKDRKSESKFGTYYDLISEQLDCDKNTNKYKQIKLIPQCLAEISDQIFITLYKSKKDDSFYENLHKRSKYTEKSSIKATIKYYKSLNIPIDKIFNKVILKYFKSYNWVPAPTAKILDAVAKDGISRYLTYVKDKSLLYESKNNKLVFNKAIQSKYRVIGYTFSSAEAKPMIAYCKNWEIMMWIKHPLCKDLKGNKPIIMLPANRHTHYLDNHKYMESPQQRIETISKCYLKVYPNSTLPCLLYNKAHTNLIPTYHTDKKSTYYKNATKVAAVFPEVDEVKREIKLSIAYTNDISKQNIAYLNATIPLKHATSIWNKLTNIKKGKKTRKEGGSAYVHTGKEYSNLRFALQNMFIKTLRTILPENIGRIMVIDADSIAFNTLDSTKKNEALYNLGYTFKNKSIKNKYKYKSFMIVHDEFIKAVARTCRDKGILMSAVPIFDVQRVCHVCGIPMPITKRAICPSCSTGGIIEAQSSTTLTKSNTYNQVIREYKFGSFTASNLLLSSIDRQYQTIVLPGDDWNNHLQKSDKIEFEHFAKSVSGMINSKSSQLYSSDIHAEGVDLHFSKFTPSLDSNLGYYSISDSEYKSIKDVAYGLYTSKHVLHEETKFPYKDLILEEINNKSILKVPNIFKYWNENTKDEKAKLPELILNYTDIAKQQYDNLKINCESKETYDIGSYSKLLDNRKLPDNKQYLSLSVSNSEFSYNKIFGSEAQVLNSFESSKDVQSYALQLNDNIIVQTIPLRQINWNKLKQDIKILVKAAVEVSHMYSIYCTYYQPYENKFVFDREVFTEKEYLQRYIATIDSFILLLYSFNAIYKELLDACYIGQLDYDDCIKYIVNPKESRLYEVFKSKDIDDILLKPTKHKYRSSYYTNVKSLATFYQYLYGIIQSVQYCKYNSTLEGLRTDSAIPYHRLTKKRTLEMQHTKEYSGMFIDSVNSFIKFNWFSILGTVPENNEYIEPLDPEKIKTKIHREQKINEFENPIPSYFGANQSAFTAGKCTLYKQDPRKYCANRRFAKLLKEKTNIDYLYKYEYEYNLEASISKAFLTTHIHPIHRAEDACIYDLMHSKFDRDEHKVYGLFRNDLKDRQNEYKKVIDNFSNSRSIINMENLGKYKKYNISSKLSINDYYTLNSYMPLRHLEFNQINDEGYFNIKPYKVPKYNNQDTNNLDTYISEYIECFNNKIQCNLNRLEKLAKPSKFKAPTKEEFENIIKNYENGLGNMVDLYLTLTDKNERDPKEIERLKQEQRRKAKEYAKSQVQQMYVDWKQEQEYNKEEYERFKNSKVNDRLNFNAINYNENNINSNYIISNTELAYKKIFLKESKWFNYTNNFEDLELIIPAIQGSEHIYRCTLHELEINNSRLHQIFNVKHKFKFSKECYSIMQWLRNPYNAEKLILNKEHFKNAVNHLYFMPKNFNTNNRYMNHSVHKKYKNPKAILNELGIGKLVNNNWLNTSVRRLLIFLAHAPVRFYSERAIPTVGPFLNTSNENMHPLVKPNDAKITHKIYTDRLNKILPNNYRTQQISWYSKRERKYYRNLIHQYMMWPDLKKEAKEFFNTYNILEFKSMKAKTLLSIAQSRFKEIDKLNNTIKYFEKHPEKEKLVTMYWLDTNNTLEPSDEIKKKDIIKFRRYKKNAKNLEYLKRLDKMKESVDDILKYYKGNAKQYYFERVWMPKYLPNYEEVYGGYL